MNIVSLLIQSVLLALGLAMDAFAVSVSNGLAMKKTVVRHCIIIAATFGIFQGLMPAAGYFLGNTFSDFVKAFDHYIALIFLGFIGGRMIAEGISELKAGKNGELVVSEYKFSVPGLLFQAVATSIDALVVGVSLVAMDMTVTDMLTAVSVIAAVTFILSLIGVFLGKRFGRLLGSKAVVTGGVILVGIGLKVFIEHTFFGG